MKKWYAVIGDPISQSMSPAMHEDGLRIMNYKATYIPVHVRRKSRGCGLSLKT